MASCAAKSYMRLAPDAELLFANWEPDRPDQFIEAVRWARGQGARVLSCSLIMPSWSDGEGGGPTHAALVELLTSHGGTADAVCFASAGNTAQRHWSGLFHDGAAHFHEWEQGRTENELSPWGNEPVSVELCWQAAGDYDLIVDDRTAHEEVARSLAQTERERASRRGPVPASAFPRLRCSRPASRRHTGHVSSGGPGRLPAKHHQPRQHTISRGRARGNRGGRG